MSLSSGNIFSSKPKWPLQQSKVKALERSPHQEDPRPARKSPSRRQARPRLHQSVGIAHRPDPGRPSARRTRQPSTIELFKTTEPPPTTPRAAGRLERPDRQNQFLPQQGQVDSQLLQPNRRTLRRQSAGQTRRPGHPPRRRPQNRQYRPRQCFGQQTIGVDTHVMRLSQRLGLTKNTDPDKIEADLTPMVPAKQRVRFCHLMQYHGRRICFAKRPRCPTCTIKPLCPYPNKTKS